MGISLSLRPVHQKQRQLAVRFYCNWYCAMSKVDVLARRFMLASNRYIVYEIANVKVCYYQVMVSNGLFEETNEQRIFLKYFTITFKIFCIQSSMRNHFDEMNSVIKSMSTIHHIYIMLCGPRLLKWTGRTEQPILTYIFLSGKYITITKQKMKILCMCDQLHMYTFLRMYLWVHMRSYASQGAVCYCLQIDH